MSLPMQRPPKIPIPDLRFEQSFMRSLNSYASAKVEPLSDAELKVVDEETDETTPELQPLAPITPGIVVFAIVKDQILMPLIQGFLLSGFYIIARPMLRWVIANGQSTGRWLFHILGLDQRPRYVSRPVLGTPF